MPVATPKPLKKNKNNSVYKNFYSASYSRLLKIDKSGRLYVPAFIQKMFKGYRFWLHVEDGRLIYEPIKVDDGFPEQEEVEG